VMLVVELQLVFEVCGSLQPVVSIVCC
jgi:hypothetical protein